MYWIKSNHSKNISEKKCHKVWVGDWLTDGLQELLELLFATKNSQPRTQVITILPNIPLLVTICVVTWSHTENKGCCLHADWIRTVSVIPPVHYLYSSDQPLHQPQASIRSPDPAGPMRGREEHLQWWRQQRPGHHIPCWSELGRTIQHHHHLTGTTSR